MKLMYHSSWMAVLAGGMALCQAQEDPNRFGLGFRMGFNLDAKFKESGGGSLGLIGPATGGSLDRTYDDGFVRRDASGNQGGQTWNWGYQNAAQVVGTDLQMHAAGSTGVPGFSSNEDPQLGAELVYERRLGQWSWGKWGLQAAFNGTDVQIGSTHAGAVNGVLVTDTYATGGIVVPAAPYAGSWAGPGPVISDTPTRSTATVAGSVESSRKLDTQLYGWRLGPYLEVPISEHFSVQLSGGLALGYVDSEFYYRDVVTTGGGSGFREGGSGDSDLLAGGYAEAQLAFRLCREASVYTGVQYQYLPDFKQSAQGVQAELGLGESLFVTMGVKLHF